MVVLARNAELLFFDLATFCKQAGLTLAAVRAAAQTLRTTLEGAELRA